MMTHYRDMRDTDMIARCSQVGERIYSLDQVELAFKSLAAGGHKGKLVVRMTQEPEPGAPGAGAREQSALVYRG